MRTCRAAVARIGGQPLLAAAAVGLVSLALAACGGGEAEPEASGAKSQDTGAAAEKPAEGGAVVIGESSPIASNPNVHAVTLGAEKAAKGLGWSYKMLDANLSPDKQVADIDTLITLKVKGIVTLTLDPGAADAAYKRASEAGIPIIGINSTSQYIHTNIAEETDTTCVPGEDAAAFMAERAPGGKVLVIGGPPVPSIQLRTKCFVDAAKKAGLKVAEVQDNMKDVAATAQPIAQSMLSKHPDVAGIFTYNDPSALGTAAALKSAGKSVWSGDKKGVMLIGINASPDAISAIKAGAMTATYDPNSAEAGAMAISALALFLRDKKALDALPKELVVKTKRWDAENVGEYVDPAARQVSVTSVG